MTSRGATLPHRAPRGPCRVKGALLDLGGDLRVDLLLRRVVRALERALEPRDRGGEQDRDQPDDDDVLRDALTLTTLHRLLHDVPRFLSRVAPRVAHGHRESARRAKTSATT